MAQGVFSFKYKPQSKTAGKYSRAGRHCPEMARFFL